MNGICSELYKNFFYKVNKATFDINDHTAAVSEAMKDIACFYHIGKCTETFAAPRTQFYVNGISRSTVLYEAEGDFEEIPETFVFKTVEDGTLDISFYPEKGHVWDEDVIDDLRFLAENLFLIGGRVQLLNIMKKISTVDTATGAANMNGFILYCEQLAKEKRLKDYVVAFINLKNFKFVNTLLGESKASAIIKKYTVRLLGAIDNDEKLARLGGDNFCILLKRENFDKFLSFISCLSFEVDMVNEKRIIDINSRVGAYSIDEDDPINFAMNAAASALSAARMAGNRDVMWFESDMLDEKIKATEISNKFPEALRNHEFVVYYQPKVSLVDNNLCGCEALTRWEKNGEIVQPMEFIPVLEREGTICTLDFYILEMVCTDIKRWIDEGLKPVRVSTNFSKLHLRDKNFADEIIKIVSNHKIEPSYIEVELTETSGYDDYESLAQFVKKMKNYGISTSIDDFGTGYSSLNLLKDLDVDIIKLDKSFLDSLGDENKNDEVVIKNIVNMVNELDMQVVAEGVETNLQVDLLQNFSCSMAQGYLFDKPLPCSEFEKRLRNGRVYK